MNKKAGIRLAIIVPLLALLGWGAWYATNWLCAGRFECGSLLESGDIEAAKWVVRWRPVQTNSPIYSEFQINCCWRGCIMQAPVAWLAALWNFPEDEDLLELMMNDQADGVADISSDEGLIDHFECYHRDSPLLNRLRRYGLQSRVKRDLSHFAAAAGWADVVRVLVKNGTPVDRSDINGWRPVHYAIFRGHAGVAAELVKAGASLDEINGVNPDGVPAIHYAAAQGNIDMVRLLVENGIDVNTKDAFGWTALHFAVYAGHKEVERTLIAGGADQLLKNADGMAPNDLLKRQPKAYKEFMGFPSLDEEGRRRFREIVFKKLVFEDEPVSNVLAHIEKEGRKADPTGKGVRIIRLRNGGDEEDATITMDFEKIPLGEAIRYVCEGADMKYDIRKGAALIVDQGVNSSKMLTWCMFMHPSYFNDVANIKKYLEDKGISFDVNRDGVRADAHYDLRGCFTLRNTPTERELIMSILRFMNGQFNITGKISNYSPVYYTSTDGVPRLHMAVYFRDKRIVRSLLQSGQDVNVVDNNGATPLDWARTKELRKLLRKYGGKSGNELGTMVARDWRKEMSRSTLEPGPPEEDSDDDDGASFNDDDDDDDEWGLDDDDDEGEIELENEQGIR